MSFLRTKTARATPRLEALEDRLALSWGPIPPSVVPIPRAVTATLNRDTVAAGSGAITNNEVDYFTFVAPTKGEYRFSTETPGSNLDTVLGVFSGTRRRLGYDDDSGPGTDSQVTVALDVGQRCYFGVTNFRGTPGGRYRWRVEGPADDRFEHNDTQAAATNLGTLTAPRVEGGLALVDRADWYRFTTTSRGLAGDRVSIGFSHQAGDLMLRLEGPDGLVGESDGVGDTEAVSLEGLRAGTYFVRVTGYAGATNPTYTLSISPPTDDAFENNDTQATAANLGATADRREYPGLTAADDDWYRFVLPQAGRPQQFVRIRFGHDEGDLDLRLVGAGGEVLRSSTGVGDEERVSLDGLAAGTYYVQVYGYNGATNRTYALDLNTDPEDEFEDNDTAETATSLGALAGVWTSGGLAMADEADWFRFSMAAAGAAGNAVAIDFLHSQGDLDLRLYRLDGATRTLVGTSAGVGDSERVSLEGLAAGDYAIEVFGYNGARNSAYRLNIDPGR